MHTSADRHLSFCELKIFRSLSRAKRGSIDRFAKHLKLFEIIDKKRLFETRWTLSNFFAMHFRSFRMIMNKFQPFRIVLTNCESFDAFHNMMKWFNSFWFIIWMIFLLQDISNMKNVISRVKGSQPAPILLVANKLDLECQREVATSEGKINIWQKKYIFNSNIEILNWTHWTRWNLTNFRQFLYFQIGTQKNRAQDEN